MPGYTRKARSNDVNVPEYHIPDDSTRYISTFHTASGTGTAIAAGRLQFVPLVLTEPLDVYSLHVNVAVAGTAGALARLGIYDASAARGYPGSLVIDGGTVALETTGTKNCAFTTTRLAPGKHWLALGMDDASGSPRLIADTGGFSWLAVLTTTRIFSNLGSRGLFATYAPGALPATAGTVSGDDALRTPVFGIGVRRV